MKLKYYLRGLGSGIVFAAILIAIVSATKGKTEVSDDDIIKRAKELGMVERIQETESEAEGETNTEKTNPVTEEETTTPETVISETTVEETTIEETTIVENTIAEAEVSDSQQDVKTITISSGMTSEQVANLLGDEGIIEDSVDFNQYLVDYGYSDRIRAGNFEIPDGSTYNDIISVICR